MGLYWSFPKTFWFFPCVGSNIPAHRSGSFSKGENAMTHLAQVNKPDKAQTIGFGLCSRLLVVFFAATVSPALPAIALAQQSAETGTQTQVACVTRIKINKEEKTMNQPTTATGQATAAD